MDKNNRPDKDFSKNDYRLHWVSDDGTIKVYVSKQKATKAEIDELYNAMIMLNRWVQRKIEG